MANHPNAQVNVVGEERVRYESQPPKGTTWKQKYIDEMRPDITDADWARAHFTDCMPYDNFITALQVSREQIYMTSPFCAKLEPACDDERRGRGNCQRHRTGVRGDA